jgi:hypothetical protein
VRLVDTEGKRKRKIWKMKLKSWEQIVRTKILEIYVRHERSVRTPKSSWYTMRMVICLDIASKFYAY